MTNKAIGKIDKLEFDVPKGTMHFFGIAIDKYANWQNLKNAVNDLEGMEKVLHEYYDFDKSNITTLKNEQATRKAIVNHLHNYTKTGKLGEFDSLLIYFSGHGDLDNNNNGYWVPVDSQKDEIDSFVANTDILNRIQNMKCLHVLLISDSCYSGSLTMKGAPSSLDNSVATTLAKKKSRWLLTSGDKKETVSDGSGKHSPFAEAILSELKHNNKPLLITDELALNVRKIAHNNAYQMAQYEPFSQAGDLGGRFVFRKKQSEETDWQWALDQNTEGGYAVYLEKYPDGKYVEQARIKRDSVTIPKTNPVVTSPEPQKENWIEFILKFGRLKIAITLFSMLFLVFISYKIIEVNRERNELAAAEVEKKKKEKEESEAWASAKLKNTKQAYEAYLQKYSQGIHKEDAQNAQIRIEQTATALASASTTTQQESERRRVEIERERERERQEAANNARIEAAARQQIQTSSQRAAQIERVARRNSEIRNLLTDANAQLAGHLFKSASDDIRKILSKEGLSQSIINELNDINAFITSLNDTNPTIDADVKESRRKINAISSNFK